MTKTKTILLGLILAAVSHAEWITPHGKAYHSQRACIALRTTAEPREITKAEAEAKGLHACGICLRAKKGGK